MPHEKPRLTIETIREMKQACAQLTRNNFIELLVSQGKPIGEAAASAHENAAQFEYLFFQADEQVRALFDIVRVEVEMRATETEIEEAVRTICGIYLHQIAKFAADHRMQA